MTRSAPQAVRPAPKGAAFGEKGHARTLNRLSWFHMQAMKADKPRLSACTSGCAISPLSGCSSCLRHTAGRSCDQRANPLPGEAHSRLWHLAKPPFPERRDRQRLGQRRIESERE